MRLEFSWGKAERIPEDVERIWEAFKADKELRIGGRTLRIREVSEVMCAMSGRWEFTATAVVIEHSTGRASLAEQVAFRFSHMVYGATYDGRL